MNLLIVDDHAIVRQGCAALVAEIFSWSHVVEAESGEEACQLADQTRFDLVVMDTSLPGISGIEATKRIKRKTPDTLVLVFSMFDEMSIVRQAMDAGAHGYVCKRSHPAILIEAVRALRSGRMFVEHELSMQLAFRPQEGAASIDDLTQRELEIFVMLAKGQALGSVAEHLCISPKTVANHATSIRSKLNVRGSTGLVHKAIELGLIQVGATH